MCVCVQVLSPTPSPGLSPLDEGQGSMRDSSPPRPAGPAAAGPASCGRADGTRPTSGRRRSALRHASHINKRAEGPQFLLCGAPLERFRPLGWSHSRRSAARPARPRPIRWLQPPVVAHRGGRRRASRASFMPSDGHVASPSSGWPWTTTPRGCLPRNQHLLDKGGACRGRPARATCASEKASKAP